MVQITYSDSIYRFTDPIRYFKANDPYYFEVDNIPIKQLEQNTKWLKDQITGLKISNVFREDIAELRPYVEGTDRRVKVNPGRFIARINDAHSITPLQRITQLLGANAGEFNTWEANALNNILINDLLTDFKTNLLGISQNECLIPTNNQALGMNGLIERAMTYPMQNNEVASRILIGTTEGTNSAFSINKPPYPISEAQLWKGDTVQTSFIIKQYDKLAPTLGFASLGVAESVFVKRWRGVARTAVVDVAEPLEIEIPEFDPSEFYYIDESGNQVILDSAKWRIDLVFIYSKPIDVSGVTIAKYNADGTATNITRPQLGIVKGAGLGVDFRKSINNTLNENYPTINATDINGVSKILPHVLDQGNNLLGVSGFPGSYPAPDDIMNLTPMILESLTDGHFALIGQSVLPIAYVICKKGESTISSENLIDIRPFFRTAELSYNERAGIAAALPSPSLANPFVTEAYVDLENRKILDELDRRISAITIPAEPTTGTPTGGAGAGMSGKVVYTSYIKGGIRYGVEGALLTNYASLMGPSIPSESLYDEVTQLYGFPAGYSYPDLPDWDVAEWAEQLEVSYANRQPFNDVSLNKGKYPLDRIGFTLYRPTPAMRASIRGAVRNALDSIAPSSTPIFITTEQGPVGINYNLNYDIYPNRLLDMGNYFVREIDVSGFSVSDRPPPVGYFIKKTIKIDRSLVPWMRDYDVDVQYRNCFPLGKGHIWVDKRYDSFTIFIQVDLLQSYFYRDVDNNNITAGYGPGDGAGGRDANSLNNSDISYNRNRAYGLFGVLTKDMDELTRRSSPYPSLSYRFVTTNMFGLPATTRDRVAWQPEGETPAFASMYPTVCFRIIGYATENYNDLNSKEPTITLNG